MSRSILQCPVCLRSLSKCRCEIHQPKGPAMTLPRISELDDETVRGMMAEAVGCDDPHWCCERCEKTVSPLFVTFAELHDGCGGQCQWIESPNYPTSLDAVAPVLATMTDVDHARYRNILHDIVKPTDTALHVLKKAFRHERNYVSATARKHCDAFLVATGKATL